MSTISSFKIIENRHDAYRSKNSMKTFCESLIEHAMKIMNFKKKKMNLLTKEQQELYENAKTCSICKEKFENKYLKDKKYSKVRDHCDCAREYKSVVNSIYNLKYSVSKKPPVVFPNGSSMIIILSYKS